MLGIKGVDIGLFEDRSHLQPSSEFKSVRRAARRLKKKLDERGLKAADIFMQMALDFESFAINHPQASRRRKARDWFLKTLDYAAEVGCRHASGLPGVHFEEEKRGDSVGRAVDELAWRVEKAQEHRIVYGVEPHIGSFADTPNRALKMVADTPGLTLTLDYSHFTPRGIPEVEVEPLIEHASHFHARGACRGKGQATFTENAIDFKRVFEVMEQTGYRGWIELEYCWAPEFSTACDNLAETIRFRDYFRSLARN
jgi:sugar phosphate isomerase/epimerase